MGYQIYRKGLAVNIELESTEMSSGGQGRIYRIIAPSFLHDFCAKIYKDEHQTKTNKEKIEYMVDNKPANANMTSIRICWPEYIVYNHKGAFCGYVMPLAFEGSRDLKIIEIFSFGKTIAQKYPKYTNWHNKYELDSPTGFLNRIKMLHNWALATEIIHKSGKYVLVDLKPENVLATSSGKISIVDTDSFQIIDGAKTFPGPVATPEYFARFAKERHALNLCQTQDCDCFALAISFYKILVGSHPYSGFKLLPPYNTDEYSDIASHIDNDLFVFGQNKQYIEQLRQNNMHERFAKLPQVLQSLFIEAFTKTKQPSATMWKDALKSIVDPKSRIRVPLTPHDIKSTSNSEMRCMCVLLVDVSGSMRLWENSLNQALKSFMSDLFNGMNGFKEYSKEQVELAVIQFDSNVEVLREPSLVTKEDDYPKFKVKGLKTNTIGAIRKAIEMVNKRKIEYKTYGLSYYRPWIILLTDGNPNPCSESEVNLLVHEVNDLISNNKFMLTAIGLGSNVDKKFLSAISNSNYFRIGQKNIGDFFQMLSASMTMADGGNAQNDLLNGMEKALKGEI